MKLRMILLLAALCLLTGCSPLLEREYSTVEPHSSKYWESETDDTLRAENYQDIVNDLLLLVGQHAETATLRLYHFEDELSVTESLERAAVEVQQETPMGAYAVEYITFSSEPHRSHYEATLQIGYRRSAEQIQSVVNATSPEAVSSLLAAALDAEKTELVLRIGYWGPDGREKVETSILELREARGLTETPMWLVNYYPATGQVGLLEFLLDPPELPPEEADIPDESDPSKQPTDPEDPSAVSDPEGADAETERNS